MGVNVGATKAGEGRRLGLLTIEAEFAGGTVGAEVVGEVKRGPGAGGDGGVGPKSTEREEAGGFVEAEAGA